MPRAVRYTASRFGVLARMRPPTSPSASSHVTRVKPRSPLRRTIGYESRPSSRSSLPLFDRRASASASTAGSSAPIVLTRSRLRRVVQRCTPDSVQSWKPATPSAHPSHTPLRMIRHTYGRLSRFSQKVRTISL